MRKKIILILIALLGIYIFTGCGTKVKNAETENYKPLNQEAEKAKANPQNGGVMIDTDDVKEIINSMYQKLYIGEVFKSGSIYIEPFYAERGILNKEIEFKNYPNTISFFGIEKANINCYKGAFDSKFYNYVPSIEKESKYFSQTFSQPKQFGLKYRTSTIPDVSSLGIALFNYNIADVDYSVMGKKRIYSENEYNNALNEVKKDKENKESDRTLDYISLDNTIIGSEELCVINIRDKKISIVLSKYNTHGLEYAGTVYVADFITEGKVIKTYKKYNYDGPY